MGQEERTPPNNWGAATLAVHADDHLNVSTDVAPPIHLSTTFDYAHDSASLVPVSELKELPKNFIYSRAAAPNTTRLESLLTSLLDAPSLTYSSGLAAIFAAYTLLRPKKVAITDGYHGAHGVLDVHKRLTGLEVLPLDCDESELGPGDVVHVETPVNPTGEARNLAALAEKAHRRGAYVLVDSTFAPPPLQAPFDVGADIVMHSGTKYIGGHSDMLCGVLSTRNSDWYRTLFQDRVYLGSVMGSLEGWLGIRSMRTLELRVSAQATNGTKLVEWLNGCIEDDNNIDGVERMGENVRKVVAKVQHASLQKDDMEWLSKQMPGGFGPVFAIMMHTVGQARALPSKLRLFHHATSLGGIESLCEWRAMSDPTVDHRLLRFSIGVERWEDLREDLYNAFQAVA